MAKYDVTFSCGHTETVYLTGPTKERENKIKYFEEKGICKSCYAAYKDMDRAKGCNEVEMLYKDYKNNYSSCNTKSGSYDAQKKTVIVYVPKDYGRLKPHMNLRDLENWAKIGKNALKVDNNLEWAVTMSPTEKGIKYTLFHELDADKMSTQEYRTITDNWFERISEYLGDNQGAKAWLAKYTKK